MHAVYAPILQVAVYVLSPDRERVLLVRREKQPDDVHHGKHLSLGGHVERGEDVATAARREAFEESGLSVTDLVLRGTIFWTGFGPQRRDHLCFVFRGDAFTGDQLVDNDEGPLTWAPVADLASVPMWESDHLWLPMVFDDDPRPFHGLMPYDDATMLAWSYQR